MIIRGVPIVIFLLLILIIQGAKSTDRVEANKIIDGIYLNKDDISYNNTIVNGDLSCGKSKLKNNTINIKIKIENSVFNGNVELSELNFSKPVVFANTTFHGEAKFSEAIFNSSADFSEAIFEKMTNFRKAEFRGESSFYRTQFKGICYMTEANFSNETHFRQALFSQDSNFDVVRFYVLADFTESIFNRHANFAESSFYKDAIFDDSKFYEVTSFPRSNFSEDAKFENVRFFGRSNFTKCRFDGDLTLKSSVIESMILNNIYLNNSSRIILDDAKFDELIVNWYLIKNNIKFNAVIFAALIENFKNLAETSQRDDCYFEYRHKLKEEKSGLDKIIDGAFESSCGYGVKLLKPICWSITIIFFFSLIFYFSNAFDDSIITSLGAFVMMSELKQKNNWLSLAVLIEGILGLIFTALFFATLLNKIIR